MRSSAVALDHVMVRVFVDGSTSGHRLGLEENKVKEMEIDSSREMLNPELQDERLIKILVKCDRVKHPWSAD